MGLAGVLDFFIASPLKHKVPQLSVLKRGLVHEKAAHKCPTTVAVEAAVVAAVVEVGAMVATAATAVDAGAAEVASQVCPEAAFLFTSSRLYGNARLTLPPPLNHSNPAIPIAAGMVERTTPVAAPQIELARGIITGLGDFR